MGPDTGVARWRFAASGFVSFFKKGVAKQSAFA